MALLVKDQHKMLPSEMSKYIDDLHRELKGQETEINQLKIPDTYVVDGRDDKFESRQALLNSIEIGDVVEAVSYIRIKQSYIVKINSHRIDEYDDRIKAEGVAMLHRKD